MRDPETEAFIAILEDADFYIVYLDDRKVRFLCLRSKQTLKKALLEYFNAGEIVDVKPCYWDDKE